jgi:putative glycosyltransferase
MDLSIVTTMYGSAPYLEEFYSRTAAAAKKITDDYEIIFVNDGSPDGSLEVALSFYEKDEKVKIIDFSRNFGHHKAMMTGLMHAHGKLVFLVDCDLEIPPESLLDFYDKFKTSSVDVVYGVQAARQDRFLSRLAGSFFYTVFNWVSVDKLPVNLTTARLMSRRYVSALVSHQEREVLIGGLWVITGFKQTSIALNKSHKGKSTYNLGHKIAIIVNAVTSFSAKPLVFIFYLGCIISLLAGLAALYLIIRRVFFGVLLAGWPSLIVSVWLLGGMTTFCLGIIGIYLSKIFMEAKQRPYTIIRQTYEHASEGKHALR